MELFDTVVIGGGPAGATAARYLAAGGIRVALIERSAPRHKPCGGAIPSTAFDEFALGEDAVVRKTNSLAIIAPSGKKINLGIHSGTLNIVDRGAFDHYLRDIACREGALLIHGEFRKLSDLGRYHQIEIRRDDRTTLCIRAEYVIGADGVNSPVRRALGLTPVEHIFTYSENIPEAHVESCELWFGKSHAESSYSWVFPNSNGCSVGTGGVHAKEMRNCYNIFLRRRKLSATGRGRGYKIPIWNNDRARYKRALFVGDAAAQVMPMTFEGIYYAMKSAQYASQAIIRGDLSSYERSWDKRFKARFRFMKKFWAYFLKNDASAEKMVSLFENPLLQKASIELWLSKNVGSEGFREYLTLFRKFLR